jgi:hypothetical protein
VELLIWVDLPWACFGMIALNGVVVEAAPIAGWAKGKMVREVTDHFERRGATVLVKLHERGGATEPCPSPFYAPR